MPQNGGENAMDLKEVMDQKNFVIVGDTLNEEKYASKIKRKIEIDFIIVLYSYLITHEQTPASYSPSPC